MFSDILFASYVLPSLKCVCLFNSLPDYFVTNCFCLSFYQIVEMENVMALKNAKKAVASAFGKDSLMIRILIVLLMTAMMKVVVQSFSQVSYYLC